MWKRIVGSLIQNMSPQLRNLDISFTINILLSSSSMQVLNRQRGGPQRMPTTLNTWSGPQRQGIVCRLLPTLFWWWSGRSRLSLPSSSFSSRTGGWQTFCQSLRITQSKKTMTTKRRLPQKQKLKPITQAFQIPMLRWSKLLLTRSCLTANFLRRRVNGKIDHTF